MNISPLNILVVGATGGIGRLVTEEALKQGHKVRALVRDPNRARLPAGIELIVGDITREETLGAAAEGVDSVIFTHGSNGDRAAMERVDYGAVRNILSAFGARRVRIVLMTLIGVTGRAISYNLESEACDWKRRSERLVRVSGQPYTIVRPGWFDYNKPDQHRLVLLQGDARQSGSSRDGVVSRRQLAEILVRSLISPQALRKTFELVAETGPAPTDFDALFSQLAADPEGALDAVRDADNMPFFVEPERVRADLETVRKRAATLS